MGSVALGENFDLCGGRPYFGPPQNMEKTHSFVLLFRDKSTKEPPHPNVRNPLELKLSQFVSTKYKENKKGRLTTALSYLIMKSESFSTIASQLSQ